jgi:AcrR family transcriptional regulator
MYSSYIIDEIQSAGLSKIAGMTNKRLHRPSAQSIDSMRPRLSPEQRRQQILKIAGEQFAATGLRSTTTAALAKAAGISEGTLCSHFGTKQRLFEEVLGRNTQERLAALRQRLFSIPDMPPLESIERMAESTVLACVDEIGNASVMVWALMEMPEFAADVYRVEIGATEALWDAEINLRLADSPLRARVAVHVAPYAVHTCMAFGAWLATLHHTPATAQAHARQYAEGIVNVARAALNFAPESIDAAGSSLPAEPELVSSDLVPDMKVEPGGDIGATRNS